MTNKFQIKDFKAKYKFMLINYTDFKYESPYKGLFEITQCVV